MASSVLTSAGVGSGIDVNSLVQQLVAAEKSAPSARLDVQQATATAQISALGTLKGALDALKTAAAALGTAGVFGQRGASSSDSAALTASADATAGPGTYRVEILALAQAQKLASGAFLSSSTVLGGGTLHVTAGAGAFDVTIDPAHATLAEIRDAINAAAGNPGVRATLLSVGDGVHLVLTASGTGTANAITVTSSDLALQGLVYDPAGTMNLSVVQAASDASIAVDGFAYAGPGNSITGVIPGVTLNLAAANPGRILDVTVTRDTAAASGAVATFVKAYNAVVSTLNTLTRYDAATRRASIMTGDALPRALGAQLRTAVFADAGAAGATYRSLSQVGVRMQADGTLALDPAVLGNALSADPAAVQALFTGEGGIAARFGALVGSYLGADGLIGSRDHALHARLDDVAAQREALTRRLDALQSRLTAQFTAMDHLVAQLRSTGDYLSQQLAGLAASTK